MRRILAASAVIVVVCGARADTAAADVLTPYQRTVAETLLVRVPLDADGHDVAAGLGGEYIEGRDIEGQRVRYIEVRTPGETGEPIIPAALVLAGVQAERDQLVTLDSEPISPDDPDLITCRQWHHDTRCAVGAIDTPSAWEIADGWPVRVGVIDTGVDCRHPELIEACDQPEHWDAVTRRVITTPTDALGHGTHVAGIIAAAANGRAGVGVAPSASIVSARACTSTNCRLTDLVSAMVWLEGRVEIINMSLGGPTYSAAFASAIHDAQTFFDVLVVASVGNDGDRSSVSRRGLYPATYPGVVGVCATSRADRIEEYSQKASVDICAPGTSIWSTLPGGAMGYKTGTSMAAPMVAGAAAVIRSRYGTLAQYEIAERIYETAREIQSCGGPDRDPDLSRCGWGRLDIGAAIRSVVSPAPTSEATPPPGSIVDPTPTPGATPTCDSPISCGVATAKAATREAAPTWTPTYTPAPSKQATMPSETLEPTQSVTPSPIASPASPTPTPCSDPIGCAEATATRAAAVKTAIHGTVIAPPTLTPTLTPNPAQALQTVEARATRAAWLRYRAFLPVAVLGTGARTPPTVTPVPTRRNDARATAIWCEVNPGRCTPTPAPPTPRPTRCPGISCFKAAP